MLLKRRYNNLKLVLFGDLNINLEDLEYKLKNKIESFGFKIQFKKSEYTRIQKVKNVEKNHIQIILLHMDQKMLISINLIN